MHKVTTSPPSKRIKLESSPTPPPEEHSTTNNEDESLEDDHCSICLQSLVDRAVIPTCSHEFCFECILLWSEQSRKCPLCSQLIGEYLIHHIRSKYDYQKHYLPPPRTNSPRLLPSGEARSRSLRNVYRERQWGRRARQERAQVDQLERAVAKRRWIYEHDLYVKHVASNSCTRYRPYPAPSQFAASPDLISRMTTFLRRELQVWPNLDVEFLTTFTISLMKSIDIRSESAIKLLAEFLDMDTPYIEGERHLNAEHFAHEIYSYLRSPYRDLNTYDSLAQYDISSDLPLPYRPERTDRWQQPSASRSLSSESPSRRSRIRSLSRPRSSVSLRENTRSRSPVEVHGTAERSLPKRGRHNRSPIRSRELSDSIHEDDPRPRRSRRNDGDEHDDNSYRTRVTKGKGKQKEQVVVLLRDSNVQRRSPVPDSTAQIRVDTPTIGNLSKDIKGKQKAEELCPSDTPFTGSSVCGTPAAATQRLDNAVPLETYSAMQTAEGNSGTGFGASRSRKPTTGNTRPPRNRTLLESVQAHLAGPSSTSKRVNPIGKITAVGQADNEHSDIIAHLATSDSRAPSMLLTNSPSLKTPSPHPNYQSFITPAVQISDISRRARRPMPLDEEGNVTDIRKFSAPEIMARARHKLSISKDDRLPGAALPASCPTVDRSDEPPSIPPIQNHIPPSPNFNAETKAGSDRRGNQESATDNKTNTSDVVSSDTRSMLLEKLKAEQKPAQNTVPHPRFSRSSPSYQATPLVFHTDNGTQHASSPNINEGDASELETKLRARLTAIKRKVNDSPLDHNNNSSSGKGGGISFNGDAESSNREESLRARLRKRLD